MKYSFVSFSCPDADLSALLAMASEFGYDGAEIRSGAGHRHGIELGLSPEAIADIRQRFAASGVFPICLSVSCHYSDSATLPSNLEETRSYLRLAEALGFPLLRVFCGVLPQGSDRSRVREQIAASLRELAPLAAESNVVLAVETHDDWSDPREMASVLSAVNHPAVGVVWDVMHTLRGGKTSMEEAYRILKPWLRHVHIHDGLLDPNRLVFRPIGQGEIDHRPVVRLLANDRYEGFLSGEWLDWEAPEVHLPRELSTMRQYEREV